MKEQKTDTLLQTAKESSGAAREVPLTKPFEGFTYLKKEWVDVEDGIETVLFNMAFGQMGSAVNWAKTKSFAMMPEWGTSPLRRSLIVRIPTHFEDNEQYLFHYFFQIKYTDGSERVSDTFTQLITPKTIEYIDYKAAFTHVIMHWSLNSWSYPQDTELEAVGLPWNDEFSVSRAAYRSNDPLYEQGRAIMLKGLSEPRIFRAKIWAPKGEEINYCFRLISINKSGKLLEKWDNNHFMNFKVII